MHFLNVPILTFCLHRVRLCKPKFRINPKIYQQSIRFIFAKENVGRGEKSRGTVPLHEIVEEKF